MAPALDIFCTASVCHLTWAAIWLPRIYAAGSSLLRLDLTPVLRLSIARSNRWELLSILDRAMSVELLIEDIAATIRRPKVNKTL